MFKNPIPKLVTGALSPDATLVQSGQQLGYKYEIWFDPTPWNARRVASGGFRVRARGYDSGHYASVVYSPYWSPKLGHGVEAEQIDFSRDIPGAVKNATDYITRLWEFEKTHPDTFPVSNPLELGHGVEAEYQIRVGSLSGYYADHPWEFVQQYLSRWNIRWDAVHGDPSLINAYMTPATAKEFFAAINHIGKREGFNVRASLHPTGGSATVENPSAGQTALIIGGVVAVFGVAGYFLIKNAAAKIATQVAGSIKRGINIDQTANGKTINISARNDMLTISLPFDRNVAAWSHPAVTGPLTPGNYSYGFAAPSPNSYSFTPSGVGSATISIPQIDKQRNVVATFVVTVNVSA